MYMNEYNYVTWYYVTSNCFYKLVVNKSCIIKLVDIILIKQINWLLIYYKLVVPHSVEHKYILSFIMPYPLNILDTPRLLNVSSSGASKITIGLHVMRDMATHN